MRFRTWQNIAPVDVSGLRAAQTANQNNLFEDGANLFKTFNQAVAGSDYRAAQNGSPQNKQDILALQRLADESGNASYIKNTTNQLDQFNTNQGIKYKFDRKSLDKRALEQQSVVEYLGAKLGGVSQNSPEGQNLLRQLKDAQIGLAAIGNERQQADNSFLGIGNNQVASVQSLPNARPIQPIPGSNPAAVQPPVQTASTSSNAVQQIQNTGSTPPPTQTPVNQINNANTAAPTKVDLEKSQLAQVEAQLKGIGFGDRRKFSDDYKNLVKQKKSLTKSIEASYGATPKEQAELDKLRTDIIKYRSLPGFHKFGVKYKNQVKRKAELEQLISDRSDLYKINRKLELDEGSVFDRDTLLNRKKIILDRQNIKDIKQKVADGKQPINNLVTQNIAPTSAPVTIKTNTSNPPTKAITTFRNYSKIVPKAQGDALLDKINTTVNQFGQDAPETNQGLVEGYKSILTSFTEQKASLAATKIPNSDNNKYIKRDNAKIDNQIKTLTAKENEIKSNINSLNQVIANQKTDNTNLERTTKNFNAILTSDTGSTFINGLSGFENRVYTPKAPVKSVAEKVALNNGWTKENNDEAYDEIQTGLVELQTDYLDTTEFSSIRDVLADKMGVTDNTEGASQVLDLLEKSIYTMWASKIKVDKEFELDATNITNSSLGNGKHLKNVIDGLFKNKKGKDFKKALRSYKGSNPYKLLFSFFPEVATFANTTN